MQIQKNAFSWQHVDSSAQLISFVENLEFYGIVVYSSQHILDVVVTQHDLQRPNFLASNFYLLLSDAQQHIFDVFESSFDIFFANIFLGYDIVVTFTDF